ncbi:hypothetical protein SAMN02745857_03701 [Andreprevotia lacus DSM 23236]|uniref:Uncharacterized protein n=1 Tax=Andreprevotia lacus DSM 23236 TaxID=1121001 RepID=A0A1W1Y0F8_9NEIS|nr:hypothetical protein [Andreprevotia lacus]SMC29228.1 hypothetical protein SAMN02745857_03701 [Andreprevotia lacus DSM 23236]
MKKLLVLLLGLTLQLAYAEDAPLPFDDPSSAAPAAHRQHAQAQGATRAHASSGKHHAGKAARHGKRAGKHVAKRGRKASTMSKPRSHVHAGSAVARPAPKMAARKTVRKSHVVKRAPASKGAKPAPKARHVRKHK